MQTVQGMRGSSSPGPKGERGDKGDIGMPGKFLVPETQFDHILIKLK